MTFYDIFYDYKQGINFNNDLNAIDLGRLNVGVQTSDIDLHPE